MAFFTSISANLLKAEAKETTTAEGAEVYEIKGYNNGDGTAIPLVLLIDKESDHAAFAKGLAELANKDTSVRVLVSGVLQSVYAEKDKKSGKITRVPKLIVYVGAIRRLRADTKLDPDQAIVFGSGFSQVVTDFHDKTKRKPELLISAGTQDVKEEGKYTSKLQVIGDSRSKTDEVCLRVEDGQEVYMMANLFRSEGVMNETAYDKIKASATFMEESDRVRSRKSGKRGSSANMTSQLSDTFEDSEPEEDTKSVSELAKLAGLALGDF